MMPSMFALPRLPRRLMSAALVLSVLSAMLGWGHASCDGSDATHDASATTVATGAHAGMEMAHHDAGSAGGATRDASRGCPDHDRHDERGAACALAAHCAVGAVASAVVVPASRVLHLAPTVELAASGPLDASYQPDSPPPKA